MKALIFMPEVYSSSEMICRGFKLNGWEAEVIDYKKITSKQVNKLYVKTGGLPNRLNRGFKNAFFTYVNKRYIAYYLNYKPDIVFIYNHQLFFPSTLEIMKKNSKIAFYLGDNPLWSRTFDYNLDILKYSDYTICPDSYWKFELSSIGMPNIFKDHIGFSTKTFYQTDSIPNNIREKYRSDILFVGRNYGDASGYKRTKFYSLFAGLDFKLFGTKEWKKWISFFPEIEPHLNLINKRISNTELNYAMNCSKIYPIDQNTGIVNGIHLRVFETIGAGILPVVEWRKDLDDVFEGRLPVIKNFTEARDVVQHYLENEQLRIETIKQLNEIVLRKYTPEKLVYRLLKHLF